MKKLPKKELRVHKVYWLHPVLNKKLKAHAKKMGISESKIIEHALAELLA